MIGPYGRQWVSPQASLGFSQRLVQADLLCFKGEHQKALLLYQQDASVNTIARRRLSIAKRQLQKARSSHYTGDCLRDLKLGFVDWYHGFEKDIHIILELFFHANLKPVISSPEVADILVAGAYGNRLLADPELSQDKLVIFFTGENISPSYNIHDFCITTRTRSYCGKNIRYPQWLTDLTFENGKIQLKSYNEDSFAIPETRDLLISAVYNNSTPEREEILSILRSVFGADNVHIFGSQRSGNVNKLEILSRSVINVCFENSLGEGYVTEKLLHAIALGCKALYWGHSSYLSDFRSENIFNACQAASIDELITWCQIQLETKDNPHPDPANVDSNIFTKHPRFSFDIRSLTSWAELILGWRFV